MSYQTADSMNKLIPARQFRKQAPVHFCWLLRMRTNTPIVSSIYNGQQKDGWEILRQAQLQHLDVASQNLYQRINKNRAIYAI